MGRRFDRTGPCVYSPSEMIDPNTLYELGYVTPSALFALVALVPP